MNANQSVYVVLSRSQTALSRTIHMLKGHQYTHAALSPIEVCNICSASEGGEPRILS
ncbi:hypothetical protein [Sinanaerobacter chloroacetimidivorans]|uniref:Uncharacterized protein n=1 Tax=Sinanaerobacter chloroacetimidivorans TaxID=2818044 RepID=A0A8J8B1C1_9FIRM|nr:hypothetical protein [Sinanaerobacter chloroacetimidivorans]MBR0597577.1 hypothetical protein [Sinanaerobacter chloroacetimidivorans]